ncbi:MAG: class A beta-lactamase-related serine hydrolase [Actinomycetota bacterium]|nr:class A beta-lactamase-related serine hydrolase [Actinomycetota bacterium]
MSIPVFEGFGFKPDRDPASALPGDLGPPATVPSGPALDAASAYATKRGGLISFATIDSAGRLRGHHADRQYAAASVIKAMVLAAELGRLKETHTPIDANTDSLLTAMITRSDNAATDVIYDRVGDAGLHAIAERAGMTGFDISGYWGNAQITAADMARFFGALDRMLPRGHREYGQGLLGSVIPSQSWGIPEAAGSSWAARFKGGWLPGHALVHQAAELRERNGPREISLVVLTDEQPSFEYGIQTVRGLARRLLTPG